MWMCLCSLTGSVLCLQKDVSKHYIPCFKAFHAGCKVKGQHVSTCSSTIDISRCWTSKGLQTNQYLLISTYVWETKTAFCYLHFIHEVRCQCHAPGWGPSTDAEKCQAAEEQVGDQGLSGGHWFAAHWHPVLQVGQGDHPKASDCVLRAPEWHLADAEWAGETCYLWMQSEVLHGFPSIQERKYQPSEMLLELQCNEKHARLITWVFVLCCESRRW